MLLNKETKPQLLEYFPLIKISPKDYYISFLFIKMIRFAKLFAVEQNIWLFAFCLELLQ